MTGVTNHGETAAPQTARDFIEMRASASASAGSAPVRLADRQAMRKQAQTVMQRLKILLPLDALVGTLPIATRQLVAICRALAGEQARLVVMDEPTAGPRQK